MSHEGKTKEAFAAGKRAAADGQPRTTNPHSRGEQRHAWHDGWDFWVRENAAATHDRLRALMKLLLLQGHEPADDEDAIALAMRVLEERAGHARWKRWALTLLDADQLAVYEKAFPNGADELELRQWVGETLTNGRTP